MESTTTSSFETEAQCVLSRLRHAFGAIIHALPGGVSRPHEVQKSLKIDKRLAWKMTKFVNDDNLFSSVKHIAGTAGIDIFLSAATRKAIPERLIHAAQQAVSEFNHLVDVHAHGRADFEMMLGGCSREGRKEANLLHRKAAFASNSYLWGVQAKVQLAVYFLNPAADGRRVDIAVVKGFEGFRRIRQVSWVLARVGCVDDDGQVRIPLNLRPVDSVSESADTATTVPLLRNHCSSPLPPVQRVAGTGGYLMDEIQFTEVGNVGAITCFTAEVARDAVPRYRDEHNDRASLNVQTRTPVEELVFDQFVHEDLYEVFEPELLVYSDLYPPVPNAPTLRDERDRLYVSETVQHLGTDPAAAYTPHIPRYAEMLAEVCKRLGWDRECFQLHRVRLPYPIIPSSVNTTNALPEEP